MAYGNNRQSDQAIADFNEVIKRDPSNAEAYSDRGVPYRAKGDAAQAKADLDMAKRLNTP
jgi:Flp pilus assembly protein TadD